MERLFLAVGFGIGACVAVLKLVQMGQWRRCTATFVGKAGPLSYTGQSLPIRFRLGDGSRVDAVLRQYGKLRPAEGSEVRIIHDPEDPTRVEWAGSLVVVAAIGAVMVSGTVATVLSWLGAGW